MFRRIASLFGGWTSDRTVDEFLDNDDFDDDIQITNNMYEEAMKNFNAEELDEDFDFIAPTAPVTPVVTTQDRIGKITRLSEHDGLIDGVYHFDRLKAPLEGLDLGKRVTYQAFRRSEEQEWRVSKIICVHEEEWNDETNACVRGEEEEEEVEHEAQIVNVGSANQRSIVGKVMRRDGREVLVRDFVNYIKSGRQTRDTRFSLDNVSSEFTPIEGDRISMNATVAISEESVDGSGDILEVLTIKPLRLRLIEGHVNSWDRKNKCGTIVDGGDQEIYFEKSVCESGYIPHKGDMVKGEAIEFEGMKLRKSFDWRATMVIPCVMKQHQPEKISYQVVEKEIDPNLLKDKGGIVVQETEFGSLPIKGPYKITVSVTNIGDSDKVLTHKLKSVPTNLKLISPKQAKVKLAAKQTLNFDFDYNRKLLGYFCEEFEVNFNGFCIVRLIKWNVDHPDMTAFPTPEVIDDKVYACTRHQMSEKYLQVDESRQLFVPGERPFKAPSFVKVRMSAYPVPDTIKRAMTSGAEGGLKYREEARDSLKQLCPELTDKVSTSNHCKRFHTLLYIAEVDSNIDVCRYSRERVSFKRSGEYLALEIPGLAEGRPSLITGDSIIVSKSWESHISAKFQGFVHKICRNEVLLKFDITFHHTYEEGADYDVRFVLGRNVFRKCHAALDICQRNQANLWLFPMGVKVKPPQILLEETPEYVIPLSGDEKDSDTYLDPVSKEVVVSEDTEANSANDNTVANFFAACKSSPTKPEASNADLKSVSDVETSLIENYNDNSNHSVSRVTGNAGKGLSDDVHQEEHTNNASNQTSSSGPLRSLDKVKESKNIDILSNRCKRVEWINRRLNQRQKQAVRNILTGEARPLPYIIFGPPGTGKTVTLVETVLQIYTLMNDSRILIATPSNSSANLMAERLLDSGRLQPGDMVRLVAYHVITEGKIPVKLLPYCATVDINSAAQENNETDDRGIANLSSRLIMSHRIVIGTCVAIGQVINLGFPRGHFSHIVVDEAGQATEPEILIPLGFMAQETGQAILAGDPRQLGPVVPSTLASSFGLSTSLLSRLILRFPYERDATGFPESGGYDPRLVTRLVVNYRSLPDILELPSTLFYDSDLEPWISDQDSYEAKLVARLTKYLELPHSAIVFLGIKGQCLRDADSPSYWNPHEVLQIINYVKLITDTGVESDDIGIITPYQKQAAKIRQCLAKLKVEVPKVGSVEEFQGQEKLVILLSTVRSKGQADIKTAGRNSVRQLLGFVNNPERLNVAISRARAFLLIVGDPDVLCYDFYWREVVKYCVEKKAYMGIKIPKSVLET